MSVMRLLYAIVAYLLFFGVFVYLVGFVGNLIVPRTVDVGGGEGVAQGVAIVINLGLIALFGIQHSVMARPGFKASLTKSVHPAIERATYVLMTVVVLVALMLFWQPIPQIVWAVEAEWAVMLLWAVFALGWGVVFISTWLLNHFELFGLQQVWLDFTGKEAAPPRFRDPLLYKMVRHPIYFGFLLAFWATPVMTVGHLVLAIGMSVYILVGIRYEERDLLDALGAQYADYRKRVGMVIPGLGKAKG